MLPEETSSQLKANNQKKLKNYFCAKVSSEKKLINSEDLVNWNFEGWRPILVMAFADFHNVSIIVFKLPR